jgi:hypothetical protein
LKIRDSVVVKVSTSIQNGVITSSDFLEILIILPAPFADNFSVNSFDFTKSQDAPFQGMFLGVCKAMSLGRLSSSEIQPKLILAS